MQIYLEDIEELVIRLVVEIAGKLEVGPDREEVLAGTIRSVLDSYFDHPPSKVPD